MFFERICFLLRNYYDFNKFPKALQSSLAKCQSRHKWIQGDV